MEKLTIEKFREFCKRTQEIYELIKSGEIENYEEDAMDALEEELETIVTTIKGSDLSEIPAEEWKNYVPLFGELDLEGTGANIDFNYINFPEEVTSGPVPIKLKGCTVTNFSFDLKKHDFSEESFDESFVEEGSKEHPEAFIGMTIEDPGIRERYNKKQLSLKDIIDANLGYDVEIRRMDYTAQGIVRKIGIEEALKIDYEILEDDVALEVLGYVFYDIDSKEDYSLEKVKEAMKKSAKEDMSRTYISSRDYEKFEKSPYFRKLLPEYFIDFSEEQTELKERFIKRELTLQDILDNKDVFLGKQYIVGLERKYNISFYHEDLKQEQLDYILMQEPEIAEFLIGVSPRKFLSITERLDLSKSDEEKTSYYKSEIERIIKEEPEYIDFTDPKIYDFVSFEELTISMITSEYDRARVESLFKEEGAIEKIKAMGITPKDLKSGDIARLFEVYGIDVVAEFDRQNGGFFSKDNFANAKIINNAFFHYAGNVHDLSQTINTKNLDLKTNRYKEGSNYDEPYTMEAFEESVRRMIVFGPTDWNYVDSPLVHKDIQGPFREHYPELFVSETIPERWQEAFYSGKVYLEDIKAADEEDKEHIIEILGKERLLAFRRAPYSVKFEMLSAETLYEITKENGSYITEIKELPENIGEMSPEEVKVYFRETLEKGILDATIPYGPNAPEYIKEAHSELFISDDAPEALKEMYYRRYEKDKEPNVYHPEKIPKRLSVELLAKNPEYIEFLEGKSLNYAHIDEGFGYLLHHFGTDGAMALIKEYPEEMAIIVNAGSDKILRFKNILEERPEFYAKKELKEMEGYSDDEIEMILSGVDTQDERILDGRRLLESKKEKFREFILTTPGYVVHCPDEKLDDFKFTEFKELERMSKFTVSDNYRRDTAEQIITSMYCFLGYAGAKEVLKLPEVSEEEIEEAIRITGVAVSGIYENVHTVKGNLKVLENLFDKLAPSISNKKDTMNVYRSLNQKLEEGYTGSIEDLLKTILEENGINFDDTKLKNVLKPAISANVQGKMEIIKEPFEAFLSENIVETPETLKLLTDTYMSAFKRCMTEKECIDMDYIRSILEKEYSRTREDGTSFYSPHVTEHLEDLMRFTGDVNTNPELASINKSVVDILKEEKGKIGKNWIRKVLEVKSRLTDKELVDLEKKLYGEESGLKITTDKSLELKDKTEEGIKEAYIILKELELPGIFTFEKGEIMFAGLTAPYSENFRDFFLANMTEILRKPEYYTEFQKMHGRMDSVIQDPNIYARYKAGRYTIEELIDDVNNITYSNITQGYQELAYRAKKSGLSQSEFDMAKAVFDKMREREKQAVPPVEYKGKKYVGRILRIDDPLALTIGNVTTCCQRFGDGQPGESSMLHSALEENGSVFVVEELDEAGHVVKPIAQSWTWRNGDRVCFDNVEIPNTIMGELGVEHAYDAIFEVYQETARRMIEVDKKALGEFLKAGKITQEQYDALVIKEVTVGGGCDDLIRNLSPEIRKKLFTTKSVKPREMGKRYKGVNDQGLYVDSHVQYVVEQNEEAITLEHQTPPVDVEVGYTKRREITRKKGQDIHSDLVNRIKEMNGLAGEDTKQNSVVARSESSSISIIARTESDLGDAKDLVLSYSESDDWYMLATEDEQSITVKDSLVVRKEGVSEEEVKLAKSEYARELLGLARIASSKNKKLVLDPDREGKFIDLERLTEVGILSKDFAGRISVKDLEKLNELISSLDKRIDEGKQKQVVDNAIVKDNTSKDDEDRI